MGLIERFGIRSLLGGAYALTAVGIALLPVGSEVAGVAYAILAGVAIGATSPLQAMYAREACDEGDLGLLMGLQGSVLGLAGGAGAVMGGVMFDLWETWIPTVVISVLGVLAAALLIRR